MPQTIDVHQHLWPARFIDELRRRCRPPYLDDWLLHTDHEPPYPVNPTHHDPATRLALDPGRRVLLSMSAPLGVESLPPDEASRLLDAWHSGLLDLARAHEAFAGWASVTADEPDIDRLTTLFTDHADTVLGVQLPADWLRDPATLQTHATVLQACEAAGRPVLIHPGPARPSGGTPAWWPAMVDYPTQLQAAWWAWRHAGRELAPNLRICFAAGAGLAPAQHERFVARSGRPFVVDPDVYVDTSSYGRQGVDALVRALGIDALVLGTDRPYAEPAEFHLGDAARHAITVTNPRRLLGRPIAGGAR